MLMTSLLRFTIRHCQSRSPGNPVSDTGTAVLSSSLSSLSLPTGQRGSAVAAPPGRRVGGRSTARRRPCQPRTAGVHLNLSSSCTSCSGTLSGPAAGGGWPAPETPPRRSVRRGQGRRRSTSNSGKTRHVAGLSSLHVSGAVRTRTRKWPIHSRESSERDGRGVCSVSRNTSSPTADRASRREASSSALRRSCRSCNLQQRPHFRSHAPHQVHSRIAGPRWGGCVGGGQGATEVSRRAASR